jgi:hypothetical protein
MVDNTKDKHKCKYVGTIGICKEEQLKQMDIWEDKVAMVLLTNGHLEAPTHEASNIKRAKKKIMKYHCAKNFSFFKDLVVPKLEERRIVIEKIHEEIGHFGESQTFEEITKHFFWHDKFELVRAFVKAYDKCQLVKQSNNMRFGIKEMKKSLLVICFTMLLSTLLDHYLKPLIETSMCLWPLTII